MNTMQNQIDKLQKELDKLKAIANKPQVAFPRANHMDNYFSICDDYLTDSVREVGDNFDNIKHTLHNYHLTEEHAKKVSDHLKDSRWFINASMLFSGGEERPDGAINHYVAYNLKSKEWVTYKYDTHYVPLDMYMKEDQAEQFKEWLTKFAPKGKLL